MSLVTKMDVSGRDSFLAVQLSTFAVHPNLCNCSPNFPQCLQLYPPPRPLFFESQQSSSPPDVCFPSSASAVLRASAAEILITFPRMRVPFLISDVSAGFVRCAQMNIQFLFFVFREGVLGAPRRSLQHKTFLSSFSTLHCCILVRCCSSFWFTSGNEFW